MVDKATSVGSGDAMRLKLVEGRGVARAVKPRIWTKLDEKQATRIQHTATRNTPSTQSMALEYSPNRLSIASHTSNSQALSYYFSCGLSWELRT